MTAFLQRVRDRRPPGAEAVADFPSLYRWSVERPDAFWPEVWEFCGVVAEERAGREAVGRGRGGAGAHGAARPVAGTTLVHRRAPQLRGEPAALRGRPRGAGLLERAGAAAELDLSRARRGGRGGRGGPARARHRPGRPGRRLPAQPPRDRHRDAGDREPRRDLVLLLARLRRQRRARPLRPDRAARPLLRRRLPVRRQDDRLAGARAGGVRADPGRSSGWWSCPICRSGRISRWFRGRCCGRIGRSGGRAVRRSAPRGTE